MTAIIDRKRPMLPSLFHGTFFSFMLGFCKKLMFTLWLFCVQRKTSAVLSAGESPRKKYSVVQNNKILPSWEFINKHVNWQCCL